MTVGPASLRWVRLLRLCALAGLAVAPLASASAAPAAPPERLVLRLDAEGPRFRPGDALGAAWHETEFHVRKAEVEYLKPFIYGDTIEAFVRIERLGTSSLTKRFELCHAETCALHTIITMVSVNVHLPSGRPAPLAPDLRAFLEKLAAA